MTSDHFPNEASISMGYQLENKSAAKRFNYKKAKWQSFSEILNSQIVNITESSLTIDQLNDKITEKIISASHKSIPYLSKKIYKTSLPPNIVNFIKERRKGRRSFQKTRCQNIKKKFNQLTSELKASLKKFWNQNWFDFIEKMGKNPLTSRPFWKKLKNEAASGPDQIHNLINSLIEIIELFNLSLREGRVPKAWKTSNITMIQKKASSLQDPLNYIPISITSCLGKLLERI
ncbi:AP-like endonuclease reverse transcriptase, partial [Brachionus plicatilis]